MDENKIRRIVECKEGKVNEQNTIKVKREDRVGEGASRLGVKGLWMVAWDRSRVERT